jgi:hypothetical protein
MAKGTRKVLWLVWLCFLARGSFYAVLLPIWEGFDEYAHMAYAQHLAAGRGLPRPAETRVSREVQASLGLTPLPYALTYLPAPHYRHDEYWKLEPAKRAELRRKLEALPPEWAREEPLVGELNYEAQQPPLYYLLMAPVQLAAGGAALPTRVLLMRLVSLLIASLVIPLGYAAVRLATDSETLSVGAVALVAAMPGFVMTAARVGNDGLSAVIFGALLWTMLHEDRPRGWSRPLTAGALLGAGLLTKAYFLTALPALAAIHGWRLWHGRGVRARIALEALVTLAFGCAVSGWWYARNFALSGVWSGLQQVVAMPRRSLLDLAMQVPHVNWWRFADSGFAAHLWIGNWSFLGLRSWMYHAFALGALIALAGLAILFWRAKASGVLRSRFPLIVAGSFYAFFWLGLAYHELTFSFMNVSSSAGWYVYSVVIAEVLLLALGWWTLSPARCRGWVLPAATASLTLLDLYGAHFLLAPYYTGFIAHLPSGKLVSFHLSQLGHGGLGAMLARVSGGTLPPPIVLVLWAAFLLATLALPLVCARASRTRLS